MGTNLSSGATGYQWDLGDGAVSTATHPVHVYNQAGHYTVALTATAGDESDTEVKVDYITASAAGGATLITRTIVYTYDRLYRLTGVGYSTNESFQYTYDAAVMLPAMTTTITSTVVTTKSYDAGSRMTKRVVDGSDTYRYTWSKTGRLTHEELNGYTVRTVVYNAAGQLVKATSPGFTTVFQYDGVGHRLSKIVNGDRLTYTLDYAHNARVLVERTITSTRRYLYGEQCIGEQDTAMQGWNYYLADKTGSVRQATDENGQVVSEWLYTADGEVLYGPKGPYVLLDCPEGMFDWSTRLIFSGGRYFDPTLGIWLALSPLVVFQGTSRRRKGGRKRRLIFLFWVLAALAGVALEGCGVETPPGCTPVPIYDWDPRAPGPHDDAILNATVQISIARVIGEVEIEPGVREIIRERDNSLGTIVGHDGDDRVIYTHNHYTTLGPASDPTQVAIIRSWDGSREVQLGMDELRPEPSGDLIKLRVPASKLDGSGLSTEGDGTAPPRPRIGTPIQKIDGAILNIDDRVDAVWWPPEGRGGDGPVSIWHSKVAAREGRYIHISGAVPEGGLVEIGGRGDSGGGVFYEERHIANHFNWAKDVVQTESGVPISMARAYWISYLNP